MKVILSGPSASGKTTLKNLLLQDSTFVFLKSYSTRSPRNENDEEYNFISVEDFESKINNNYFFEYERIFNNYYGLPNEIHHHNNIILTLDVKGALKMKKQFEKDCICIMVLPPSMQVLKNRINIRGCKDIKVRLARAQEEINQLPFFDYVLINDNLLHTLQKLKNIIEVAIDQQWSHKYLKEQFHELYERMDS